MTLNLKLLRDGLAGGVQDRPAGQLGVDYIDGQELSGGHFARLEIFDGLLASVAFDKLLIVVNDGVFFIFGDDGCFG